MVVTAVKRVNVFVGATISGVMHMSGVTYSAKSTALLFVDPYNDFLSEAGKV